MIPQPSPPPVIRPDTFPRWVLLTAGGILAFSLISVALVRITGNGPDQLAAAVTAERSLRFEDRADGGISVIDGQSAELLTTVHGEQGFLRGAVRTLARSGAAGNLAPSNRFN